MLAVLVLDSNQSVPHGIRVVGVVSGAIATPIREEMRGYPEERRKVKGQIPLERIAQGEEVSAAIAQLAGPEAGGRMVGSTLLVDGGMLRYLNSV